MTRQRLLQIVKWVWVAVVILGALYYLMTHYRDIFEYVRLVSIYQVLISVLFLVAGKFLLAQISRLSLHGQPWVPSFPEMLHINSMTQLAKYLPGGFWHFVGRWGVYQAKGLPSVAAGRVMLIENLWLVLSAVFVGAITGYRFALRWFGLPVTPWAAYLWILGVVLIWLGTFWGIDRFLGFRRHSMLWIFTYLILLLGGAWLLLGFSFGVLFPHPADLDRLWITSGTFCLSWSAGYLAVFAPSGLGVREGMLSLLLADFYSPQASLVYATLNRVLWIVVELILGVVCEILWGSRGKRATMTIE